MDQLITFLQEILLQIFRYPWMVVVLLATLPIVEARLAIPMAISYGYSGITPFLLGFAGSTLMAPLLLIILMPLIEWLSKTRLFKKLGQTLYDKFAEKSKSVDNDSGDLKKMLAIFLFVAVPLPLTGVWTGCAVASICKLKFGKSLASIVAGNLVACAILSVLCTLFSAEVINYIIAAVGVIAVATVAVLLIKAIARKA